MVNKLLVLLVEVTVDVGPDVLTASSVFLPPPEGPSRFEWWGAFHRGLDAAVLERWSPAWEWQATDAHYEPFTATGENAAKAQRVLSINMNTAERWSVSVTPKARVKSQSFSLNGKGKQHGG